MNLIKRTYLYLVRKKGKTVSLLTFMMVMATMMLTCISIYSATKDALANVRIGLKGSFTINAKTLADGLPEETVNQILSIEGLSGDYELRSYTQASFFDVEGNALEIETEATAIVPDGYEHAGKLVANSNSEQDTYFTEAGFQLIEGTAITPAQSNVALVHKDFAERNALSVGDVLILGDVENTDRRTTVIMQGIFINTELQESPEIVPSYDLYPNIVFTDISTCASLVYGNTGRSQYGDFYVNNPEALEAIVEAVNQIPGMEWQECVITMYDRDYQSAKDSLESIQNIVLVAMAVITATCLAVLALLLTFRLRGRIDEIGVLVAIGISKRSILAQQLVEVFVITAMALMFASYSSGLLAQQVGNALLSQTVNDGYEVVNLREETDKETAESQAEKNAELPEIEVSISTGDYLLVWMIGIIVCGASTATAVIPILKMKPKDILSQMG